MLQVNQVVIIGTGLLGASIGLGLKRAGYAGEVVGLGRRASTLEAAQQRGAVDRVTTDFEEAVADGALVLVAVPLGGFAAVFDALAKVRRAGLIVTDVGSTKANVLREASARLPASMPFVGSHPMAGSEQQGPGGSRADLFDGKPCIITQDGHAPDAAVATVEALWKTLNMSILRMSSQEHDRQTAAISHLPHAAAVAIISVVAELGGWEIASTGLRDTTRLASSNPPMRADIMTSNREQLVGVLDRFTEAVGRIREALANGDDENLLRLLQHAKQERDAWTESRGAES